MLHEDLSGIQLPKNGTGHTRTRSATVARLSDIISERLGVDIVCGLYAVGEALPTEVTLSKHWNVSRTAVREGLCALASKGLVETRTKAGTLVTERSRWRLLDPQLLSWMRLAEPNEAFVRSLLELRLIIEPQAAALAAKRRTSEDLAELSKALEIISDTGRTEESARRAEIQFHGVIINAARNQTLLPLMASIEAAVSWSNTYKARRGISVRDSLIDHQRIFEAVLRKDDAEARWSTEMFIRSAMDISSTSATHGVAGNAETIRYA
jgi:DNA-binding FadR family transcriptional regulator